MFRVGIEETGFYPSGCYSKGFCEDNNPPSWYGTTPHIRSDSEPAAEHSVFGREDHFLYSQRLPRCHALYFSSACFKNYTCKPICSRLARTFVTLPAGAVLP